MLFSQSAVHTSSSFIQLIQNHGMMNSFSLPFLLLLSPPQAWSFLSNLPVLEVEMSVKGWWEENQERNEYPLPAVGATLREKRSWLDVHADQEYVLQLSLRRINVGQRRVSIAICSTTDCLKSYISLNMIAFKHLQTLNHCSPLCFPT